MDGDSTGMRFRLLALLQLVGGLLILAFVVFPTPTTRIWVDVVLGLTSVVLAGLTWLVIPRLPAWATHASVVGSTVVTGLLVYLMATDQGQVFSSYGFVMVGAFAASFFAWRGLVGHLVLICVTWLLACTLNPVIASPVITILIAVMVVLISVAFHVITERVRAAGERTRAVWQSQIDPFVLLDAIVDRDGSPVDLAVAEANDAALRDLGVPRDQLDDVTARDLLTPTSDDEPLRLLLTVLESGEPLIVHRYEMPAGTPGAGRCFDARAFRAGRSLALTWSDVTELARAEREVTHRALHDDLTGFLNRRAGLELMADLLADRRVVAGGLAVLFCDLDNFKDVNDAHGHEEGDDVLRRVSERVRAALRHDDVIVRAGGDEFLVILRSQSVPGAALALAEKLRQAVEAPMDTPVGPLRVGLSVGVVEAEQGETVDHVVARADRAMYDAKHQGRGRVVRG